jgi:uncharacterized membrane-anchored protein
MQNHPLRVALHNEIHARPPEPLRSPLLVSHVVMLLQESEREACRAHLAQWLRNHHLPPPAPDTNHLRTEVAGVRVRWELHTEFVSYTFFRPADDAANDGVSTALQALPEAWLATLPGACLCKLHLTVTDTAHAALAERVRRIFRQDALAGSSVADGQAQIFTDFVLQPDDSSHALVLDHGLSPRRLGRLVQRLLEIETYRMGALLGLPVARDSGVTLARGEAELVALATLIRTAKPEDEAQLLDRLTRLAGEIEGQYAATHSRFSASSAYFELVRKRIADIAETRLDNLQSIRDFMDRRLTPAMNTCDWVVRRQQGLSERISRMSHLLRTRVEIEQQQSSRDVLTAMNERQALQLRLQRTVEGLSVAAITYYVVGLIGYLAKGIEAFGASLDSAWVTGVSVPIVALAAWGGLRLLHKRLLAQPSP